MGANLVLQDAVLKGERPGGCCPHGSSSSSSSGDRSGANSIEGSDLSMRMRIFCCGHACAERGTDLVVLAEDTVGNDVARQHPHHQLAVSLAEHEEVVQRPPVIVCKSKGGHQQHPSEYQATSLPAASQVNRGSRLLRGLSPPSKFVMSGTRIPRDSSEAFWEESHLFEDIPYSGGASAPHDFQRWTQAMAKTIRDDHRVAIWALSPATMRLLTGRAESGDEAAKGESPSPEGEEVDQHSHIVAALSEVVDRVRPVELVLLAMAFSHLARRGAGRGAQPGTIDSRHPDVEAFLLKYTCLESCCALRRELGDWCPAEVRLEWGNAATAGIGGCSLGLAEGPDDRGPPVTYELFAGFIGTHSAPHSLLEEVGLSMLAPCGADMDASTRLQMQRCVEKSLGPLLVGGTAEGDVSGAARRARSVAHCATMLALQGKESRLTDLAWTTLTELHIHAAAFGRILTMHLTGDLARWRGNAASNRVRIGAGGG